MTSAKFYLPIVQLNYRKDKNKEKVTGNGPPLEKEEPDFWMVIDTFHWMDYSLKWQKPPLGISRFIGTHFLFIKYYWSNSKGYFTVWIWNLFLPNSTYPGHLTGAILMFGDETHNLIHYHKSNTMIKFQQ